MKFLIDNQLPLALSRFLAERAATAPPSCRGLLLIPHQRTHGKESSCRGYHAGAPPGWEQVNLSIEDVTQTIPFAP